MASNYFILSAHASIFIQMFSVPVHPRNNNIMISYETYPIGNLFRYAGTSIVKKKVHYCFESVKIQGI